MRKKFYRQAKKAICIATLSATVLSSIPMIPYTQAYAKGQTTMEELQALNHEGVIIKKYHAYQIMSFVF